MDPWTKQASQEDSQDMAGCGYEIRIRDHLDPYWTAYFHGWSICNLENGEVLLTIPRIDQAGLHGVLNRIQDLNLTLISVRQIKEKV